MFRDSVIARIVEPTRQVDAARVLTHIEADTLSYKMIQRHLVKINTGKYRDAIAGECFTHAADLRRVGYSEECPISRSQPGRGIRLPRYARRANQL